METTKMPRQKGTGKGATERFNIRLDPAEASFYRTKANEHGISMSEFLRRTLVQGIIAENVQDIETRMRSVLSEVNPTKETVTQGPIPTHVIQSIFTSEALLTAIVEARDIQQLYQAQDKAKARLEKLKKDLHGPT
jgi:hypothetical protein